MESLITDHNRKIWFSPRMGLLELCKHNLDHSGLVRVDVVAIAVAAALQRRGQRVGRVVTVDSPTVSDLLKVSEEELLQYPGFGHKTLVGIQKWLEVHSLSPLSKTQPPLPEWL